MFRSFAVACALLLSAGAAVAEPYDNFIDLCLDGNGDRTFASAAAKRAGWTPFPNEAVTELEAQFRDPAVFLNFDPNATRPPETPEFLMTGWGAGGDIFEIPGIRVDVCIVATPALDTAALQRRVTTLLGFESIDIQGQRAWVFSRQGSAFHEEEELLVMSEEELHSYVRERKIFVVGLLAQDGMAGLMLGALRPD